jgi:hypothetical protein
MKIKLFYVEISIPLAKELEKFNSEEFENSLILINLI